MAPRRGLLIAAVVAVAFVAAFAGVRMARRRGPPRNRIPNAPAGRQQSCDARAPGAGPSCGEARDADCCESRAIPGGSFLRSFDGAGCRDGSPATVSAFALDTYEVTVGRFRAFVQAGMGTQEKPPGAGEGAHPLIAASGWDPAWNASLARDPETLSHALVCHAPFGTWTATPGENEALPINCVTWFEAFAFCAWDGGRLPTDAERNYAASGGDEQRVYPWSTGDIDSSRAVFGSKRVEPVGSHRKGDGRWGHADLSGNVWEWTMDRASTFRLLPSIGADMCGSHGYPLPCADCASLDDGPVRVLRGGGFGMPGPGMIASIRRGNPASDRQSVFGVRCARAGASGAGPTRADAGTCAPRCEERQCGPDACGGSCGVCSGDTACDGAGRCAPYPPGKQAWAEGAVMPNGVLQGFASPAGGDRTLVPVALADYYDPSGNALFPGGSAHGAGRRKPRALLVELAAGWSDVSRKDADMTLPAVVSTFEGRGGRVLFVLLEGDRKGQPADVPNLFAWVGAHAARYPAVVDTSLAFARRVDPAPSSAIVDPRTMRIVKIATGAEPPGAIFWKAWEALLDRP